MLFPCPLSQLIIMHYNIQTFFTVHCTANVGILCKLTSHATHVLIQIDDTDDKGPSTNPCGTSLVTGLQSKKSIHYHPLPPTTKPICLIQFVSSHWIPCSLLPDSLPCGTLSKVLLKSISIESNVLSVNPFLKSHIHKQDWWCMKPCWLSLTSLCLFKYKFLGNPCNNFPSQMQGSLAWCSLACPLK